MASTQHTQAVASAGSRARISSDSGAPSLIWRAGPALLAGVAVAVVELALAWRQGGYFADAFLPAGCAVFAVLAVVLVVRPPYYRIATPALVSVAALGALAAWTGLSSRWSSAPDVALEDFERDLLYVGVLGLGILAAGSGRYSRHLLWSVLALVTVVVGAGLISRLEPNWINPFPSSSRFALWRLSYPVGYWNALGAMGAMGVVLGTGVAGDPRSPFVARGLAAGAVVVLGTATYLTFSRGAWLAFFVGVAVLVIVAPRRAALLTTGGICGVALFATIVRLGSYRAIIDGPRQGRGIVAEGHAYLPFLIAVVVLAIAAQLVATGRWMPEYAREALARRARRLGLVAGALVLIALAGFYLVRSGEVEGSSATRLQRTSAWISRQWDEFMAPATVTPTTGTQRVTNARGTRSDLYRVAIDGFQAHPLWGDGSGGFEYRFAHDRRVDEKVRDAHSLYLETLGELGLPGLIALLACIGAAGWAAVQARRRGSTLTAGQAAAAAGGLAVWVAHAGVDWDWQVPALTTPALLIAASLFPEGRRRRSRRKQTPDARR